MDYGSLISQMRGMGGMLPTMQFGGGAPAGPGAAPAVPADGTMPPTIGPGTPPPGAAQAPIHAGLPSGGLLAMMQGRTNPQGLIGMLKRMSAGGPQPGAPMASAPSGAGMLGPGLSGPSQIGAGLPMQIKPMDMF